MSIISRGYNRVMARVDALQGNDERATDRIVKIAVERLNNALDREALKHPDLSSKHRSISFNLTALDYGFGYFGISQDNPFAERFIKNYVKPIIAKARESGLDLSVNYTRQFPCTEYSSPAKICAKFSPLQN